MECGGLHSLFRLFITGCSGLPFAGSSSVGLSSFGDWFGGENERFVFVGKNLALRTPMEKHKIDSMSLYEKRLFITTDK